ncbi:MAG: hydroxylamine reductase [delta proteobacterium ML8_F1]|nr:MAG: hydroxylamine reductase [delta proteobacterium ML8_F1]
MSMFCYQCQETARNQGCTVKGVCGKPADVANLQDLLIYLTKGLAKVNAIAEENGLDNPGVAVAIKDNLFTTITNANFDKEAIVKKIKTTLSLREAVKSELGLDNQGLHDAATWIAEDVPAMEEKAQTIGVLSIENEDVRSLKELITYGLKGMAAYGEHAYNLKEVDLDVDHFIQETMSTLLDEVSVEDLIALTLKTGEYGVKVMALLDKANTQAYGNPEITQVDIGVRNLPGILVSGHDLKDFEMLLEQTKDQGIHIYTHSEMLPANYYPKFKQYEHFVGNYGNAWWKQDKEFETFNGPILMTTNCIVPVKDSYRDRIYTTGSAGYPGVPHIEADDQGYKNFGKIIEQAKKSPAPTEIEKGTIIGGFAHDQVVQLADKIVDAVKTGAIRQFFVMAGCDGRMKSREYYTEFAEALPKDTVILTAGCAKYRYNKLNLGDIGGIPRVLDAGQCNDSYSLAVIALKLKEIFQLNDINELPISYNIAWYEQKAVIVLLALLSLGVKDIHLGPSLPAFLSPNVVNVLVENFGIAGISDVENDLKIFLG